MEFFCPSQRCVGSKSALSTSLVESFSLGPNPCISVTLKCPHCMIALLQCECCGVLIQDEPQRSYIHCYKCGFINLLDTEDRKLFSRLQATARPLSFDTIRTLQRSINCQNYKKKLKLQIETLTKRMKPVSKSPEEGESHVSSSQVDSGTTKKKRVYASQSSGDGDKRRKSMKSPYYFGDIEEIGEKFGLTEERFVSLQLLRSYQMVHDLDHDKLIKDDEDYVNSFCTNTVSTVTFEKVHMKALDGFYALDEKLGEFCTVFVMIICNTIYLCYT